MSQTLFVFKSSVFKSKLSRRVAYGLLAFLTSIGISFATPQVAQAGLFDLIFNGIQVLQIANMSDQQETNLGRQVNQELVNSGEFRVYNNDQINTYVNNIGQRLVPYSDRPNLTYVFQVVDDDSVNAFATMGGYVYVTTGLLKEADNESEVAGVIGHEIGHIAGKHSLEQMKQTAIANGVAGGLGLGQNQLIGLGVQVALYLPASREDEYEADRHGFTTMGEAGYDQDGIVTFMEKLVRSGNPPEFLSTHPDARNRVNALRGMLETSGVATAVDGTNATSYSSQISALR